MSKRMFIIKADDYGRNGASIEPWRRFIDSVLDLQLNASIGVVGVELGKNLAVSRYLRAMHEEYDMEVWNHSHTHSDYTKNSDDIIVKDLHLSQAKINDLIGCTPEIFGAPFNYIDQRSADAVINTNIFSGYYAFDSYVLPGNNIDLKYFCPAEVGTNVHRPVRFDVYKDAMLRRGYPDFIVIQVHPYYWSKGCIGDFRKILRDLKSNGYTSCCANDRLDYIEATKSLNDTGSVFGLSLGRNMAFEDSITKSRNLASCRDDSKYYFRVLEVGSAEIYNFLRSIGFHCTPMVSGVRKILDVGAGIGNWSIAAALLPHAEVISLDREDTHLQLLANNISEGSNISVVYDDFLRWDGQSGAYSAIICNNTLSYISPRVALSKAADLLCFGGSFLVGIQNRLYPINDAISAVKRFDYEGAIVYLERLINNEAAASGLLIRPFIRYFNSSELAQLSLESGLKLMLRGLSSPGEYGYIQQKPTFSTYLILKTKAASVYIKDIAESRSDIKVTTFVEFESQMRCILDDLEDFSLLTPSVDGLVEFISNILTIGTEEIVSSPSLLFFLRCLLLKFKVDVKFNCIDSTGDDLFDLVICFYAALVINDVDAINSSREDLENFLLSISDSKIAFWL